MIRFSLELDENNTRPIVVVHGGLQALIDTGAEGVCAEEPHNIPAFYYTGINAGGSGI